MAGDLQPLDEKFQIVGSDGRPTLYFIKWAQQRQIDISAGITAEMAIELIEEYLADHELQEGSGIQITPSGNISDSPTIAADVQEILDQITSTRGAIIYRGLLGWAGLLPGTAGQVLQTNGAGADPTWVAAGGGGGGVFTSYNVATAGDAFIDVPLDVDNGYAYEVIVNGVPSANAAVNLRMSDDNGATFKAGATDYKHATSNAASAVSIGAGTVGSGRRMMTRFILTGMNVVATEDFLLNGVNTGVDSGGSMLAISVQGAKNTLAAANWNAFRVLVSAGNMNAFTVRVKKII